MPACSVRYFISGIHAEKFLAEICFIYKKKIYIYLELKDDLGDFLMVLLQMIYSCAVGLKLMLSLTGNVLILLNSFPSERT